MLILCASGGFERFVLELSEPAGGRTPDMKKLMRVAANYKIDILGPLPEMRLLLRIGNDRSCPMGR
jgi:hypothetical protein